MTYSYIKFNPVQGRVLILSRSIQQCVKVHRYNQLMKDFPLNELLAATDANKVRDSLLLIFGHLNKKLKLS